MNELQSLFPAIVGAAVALVLRPVIGWIVNWIKNQRMFNVIVADLIRDYRESTAVLESILISDKLNSSHPIDAHIEKLYISNYLTPAQILDMSYLSHNTRLEAFHLTHKIDNISRDAKSLLSSKRNGYLGKRAFREQCLELAIKLRAQANEMEVKNWWARRVRKKKGQRKTERLIFWEDGVITKGLLYEVKPPEVVNQMINERKI